MRNRVVLIWRGAVEALPPAVSLAQKILHSGCDVTWIVGTATRGSLDDLAGMGIQCIPLDIPSDGSESYVEKGVRALKFRTETWRAIRQLGSSTRLWVLNAETAIALGRRLFRHKYVLHLYELHETRLKRYLVHPYVARASVVVCPEQHRAAIIRLWHGLKETPITIPNVSVTHDMTKFQEIEYREARSAVQAAKDGNRRIALYQGLIRADRDLSVYCEVFAKRSSTWRLLLMGRDYDSVDQYRSICPDLVHIDHIDAPRHLQVTSWASLGLVGYNYDSLNNLYCAPNKIFEYGSFGIPILANDVPGLQDTVKRHSAGMCVNARETDLSRALDGIEGQYDFFAARSRQMYDHAATSEMPDGVGEVLAGCA